MTTSPWRTRATLTAAALIAGLTLAGCAGPSVPPPTTVEVTTTETATETTTETTTATVTEAAEPSTPAACLDALDAAEVRDGLLSQVMEIVPDALDAAATRDTAALDRFTVKVRSLTPQAQAATDDYLAAAAVCRRAAR